MKINAVVQKFNNQIALRANAVFASMAFFYGCLIFSLIPAEFPTFLPFVQYASSGVLQLVALPLLGVGTILAARETNLLAGEQHKAVMESHKNIRDLLTILRDVAVEDLKIEHNEDDIIRMLKKIEAHLGIDDPKPEVDADQAAQLTFDDILERLSK